MIEELLARIKYLNNKIESLEGIIKLLENKNKTYPVEVTSPVKSNNLPFKQLTIHFGEGFDDQVQETIR